MKNILILLAFIVAATGCSSKQYLIKKEDCIVVREHFLCKKVKEL